MIDDQICLFLLVPTQNRSTVTSPVGKTPRRDRAVEQVGKMKGKLDARSLQGDASELTGF